MQKALGPEKPREAEPPTQGHTIRWDLDFWLSTPLPTPLGSLGENTETPVVRWLYQGDLGACTQRAEG